MLWKKNTNVLNLKKLIPALSSGNKPFELFISSQARDLLKILESFILATEPISFTD